MALHKGQGCPLRFAGGAALISTKPMNPESETIHLEQHERLLAAIRQRHGPATRALAEQFILWLSDGGIDDRYEYMGEPRLFAAAEALEEFGFHTEDFGWHEGYDCPAIDFDRIPAPELPAQPQTLKQRIEAIPGSHGFCDPAAAATYADAADTLVAKGFTLEEAAKLVSDLYDAATYNELLAGRCINHFDAATRALVHHDLTV